MTGLQRSLLLSVLVSGLACVGTPAWADTLLIDRAQMGRPIAQPARGMSMAQVEKRFGAPMQRLEPRGGQKADWPLIRRWVYANYTVYFERTHVIDIVLNHAMPEEIGPAPVR